MHTLAIHLLSIVGVNPMCDTMLKMFCFSFLNININIQELLSRMAKSVVAHVKTGW